MEENNHNEELVAKYKRLLSLARSNLEANQTALAEKDKYISKLLSQLEEEKSIKSSRKKQSNKIDEQESVSPKNLLRRVDLDGHIWVLIEYEMSSEDKWVYFENEDALDVFIQSYPGIPLNKPKKSLTVEESYQIVIAFIFIFLL